MNVVTPFPFGRGRHVVTAFDRPELMRILDLYGRMVAAGHWRDYAMQFDPRGLFRGLSPGHLTARSAHRKTPRASAEAGCFCLFRNWRVAQAGADLALLAPLERRLCGWFRLTSFQALAGELGSLAAGFGNRRTPPPA